MNIGIVLNPRAGRADEAAGIESALAPLGPITLYEAMDHEGTVEAARRAVADGVDLVIAAGGDGTINGVVNALAGAPERVRMGVLPLGTGNDFARSIGLPLDLEDAFGTLRSGRTAELDLIWSSEPVARFGINVATGGFSGEVNEELTDDLKRRWGPLAYVRAALEALTDLEPYDATLELGDGERIEERCVSVVVANGRFVAGGIPIAPRAEPNDGLLDVLIVRSVPPARLALLGPMIVAGKHLDSPEHVIYRRTDRVRIRAVPSLFFNLDGEPLGRVDLALEVRPARLEVIVGPAWGPEAPR